MQVFFGKGLFRERERETVERIKRGREGIFYKVIWTAVTLLLFTKEFYLAKQISGKKKKKNSTTNFTKHCHELSVEFPANSSRIP